MPPAQRDPRAARRADRGEPGRPARVVEFNVDRGVSLYRISSQLIPFASHPVNDRPWWDDFAGPLAEIADVIARSRMRVSVHPGQFTVLNSPNPKTVADSLRELEWHARLLDTLRTDPSCKIILHVGGAYGGRPEAMDRFVEVANLLPDAVSAGWSSRTTTSPIPPPRCSPSPRARDCRSSSTGCTTTSTRARTPAPTPRG
ncbi:MAG: hypothetical protein WKF75_17100 [Singulisphaera sp.]